MKKHLLIFCLLIPQFIFAQFKYPSYSGPGVSTNVDYGNKAIANGFLQSPNAAGLGVYGNTDISPFTGLPNISIPVFNISSGDLSLSAELRYLAGGVKPDDHPGWVGQNWSLNVGGVVTRKVNGGLDEVYTPDNPTDKWQFAYWYKFAGLAPTNWDTQSYLNSYLAPDKNNLAMLNPDEFSFTLPNGKSGSFFKNHLGLWQVKSESPGNFSIDVQLVAPPAAPLSLYSAQRPTDSPQSIFICIFSIVITDNDGTKYTFGNNINAIEFTRGPKQDGFNDIIANSWFLTKMESIKGNAITFTYERGPHQLIQGAGFALNLSYGITGGTKCNGNNYNFLNHSATMITPCYLAEINTPSCKVSFQREPSQEKRYDYNYDNYGVWYGFTYSDIGGIQDNGDSKSAAFAGANGLNLTLTNGNRFYKLKSIRLFDKRGAGTFRQNYSFYYNTDDISGGERLFLQRFQKAITMVDDDPADNYNYDFQYNRPEKLPEYNTLMTDEWGYYNGKKYTIGETNKDSIEAHLMPDSAFMRTGILTKIIYPTKGYTTFEYEPNSYSSVIKREGGGISYTSGTGIGGGLRIKKITDYSLNATPTYKQYFYEKAGSPTTSSGVLAGHKQIYVNAMVGPDGAGHAEYISNNSLIDLNYTNGRDVVYSRVKEQLQDGSYTIYNYSNSDSLRFRDEAPVNVYGDGITATNTQYGTLIKTFTPGHTYPFSAHTTRELERGKLLSKLDYNSTGILVRKQVNTYNDDPTRFTSQFVKSYIYSAQAIVCNDAEGRVIGQVYERYIEPVKIYTYLPYLKSQADSLYDISGNLVTATTQNFSFDTPRHLLTEQSFTDSEGQLVKTQLKYPTDLLGNDPNGVYNAMITRNMNSNVIETKSLRGSTQTSFSRTNYGVPFAGKPNLIVPLSIEKQSGSTNPVEKLVSYTYDQNNGNILTETQEGGMSTGYQWGYAGQYPIAKCVNANDTEFYTQNFEDAPTVAGYGAHTGINYYTGNNYTVNWTKPASRGAYKISYWYRLSGKWLYSGEIDYTGPSMVLNLGDAKDDIRIYPADGLLSTYTFSPLDGMTSAIDPKGNTTTYEYDNYNRLKNIKDQDGNILKTFCYNLKGDETGCAFSGLVVYNDAQDSTYKKNNCAPGYRSAASYPYSIAAGLYAGFSKADANNKARAALDSLGRANANATGTCVQNTIPITYANLTYRNAGVSRLRFKTDAGAIVYDFTEAQLIAGQTILPGLYTAEITTYGTAYNPTTQNGWGNFDFSIIGPPSYHYVQNTNMGNGPYVYVLDDMSTATHIYLYINPDFF
jgi:YD repeat-containing protein